jgi:H/ACA ribonucleoprotein complex subunit 3
MARHILFCKNCKEYTMEESCPICGNKSIPPQPAKYSPDDKYAELKREAKTEDYRNKGFLKD